MSNNSKTMFKLFLKATIKEEHRISDLKLNMLSQFCFDEWINKISDYYGYDAQSDILLEEMSELQKEILKKRRGADNHKEIVNEIADVQIMLDQMIHLLNITNDELAIAMRSKLSRQLSRIRKDKKQKAIEKKEKKEQDECQKDTH